MALVGLVVETLSSHAGPEKPVCAGRVRSPFFCGNLLHHLDLEGAPRHWLLQPSVLLLEMAQALHVYRLQLAEALAPQVNGLVADPLRPPFRGWSFRPGRPMSPGAAAAFNAPRIKLSGSA